jgi:hypothetical protein
MSTKITGAKTPLEKAVQKWANEYGQDYENGAVGAFEDLAHGGCGSGIVSELIYYSDTVKFYKKHKSEITRLLSEAMDSVGVDGPDGFFGDEWDTEDPFINGTQNQNLLSWFGFEEAARILSDRNGVEI